MTDQTTETAAPVAAPTTAPVTAPIVAQPPAPVAAPVVAPAAPLGTDDIKHLLSLLIDAGMVAKQVISDGKVGISDLGLLLKLIPDLGPAFSGLAKVPAEVKDLTADELADLVTFVTSKVVVESQKATDIIDNALKLAVSLFGLIKALTE